MISSSEAPNPGTARRIAYLAVGYVLLLVAIWTARPAQLWWSLLAAGWIVFSVLRMGRGVDELGLTLVRFKRSAWIVGAAVAVATAMAAAALALGTLHPFFGLAPQIPHALLYAFWALQQEFILQCFFFVELQELLGTRWAIVAAAVLFATAHLPNPMLTACTLMMALLFAAAFARYRNLYVLGIAHAILGLALAISVPDDLHRHMRVGLGYLHYHTKVSRTVPLR